MRGFRSINARHIVVILLAVGLLVALVTATGGGFSDSSAPPTPEPPPAAETVAPGPVTGPIHGQVRAQVVRLAAHTWKFVYVVRNSGNVPIAGFELNGPSSNLFHIRSRIGWTFYGSGVCGGRHGQVLVYWSTGPGGTRIQPGTAAVFGFTVNTTGSVPLSYSLSSGAAQPQFGPTRGPAGSTQAAGAACGT